MSGKDNHVNARGNTHDRRMRRLFLLSPESGFGGNNVYVPCWECGTLVDYASMVVDRIVPGCRGGGYQRWNIRPQCHTCADRQSHRLRGEQRNRRHPKMSHALVEGHR
jgi:5-methylcytosine-specific restriction endonuclease McrA